MCQGDGSFVPGQLVHRHDQKPETDGGQAAQGAECRGHDDHVQAFGLTQASVKCPQPIEGPLDDVPDAVRRSS